jgi:hypothetical protein
MAIAERGSGLQIIFSFFLGLMVTTFIGVGVYTFHPPNEALEVQMEEVNRREREVRTPVEPTAEESARLQEIEAERIALFDAQRVAREEWGRSTSIILIILATLVMAVSLVRADQLPVISNGLLLGGVFTMVSGVGWIVATDTSVTRFVAVSVAFAITLGLGYARFVRRQEDPRTATAGGPSLSAGSGGDPELAGLEERVRSLEARLEAAASVFGGKGERAGS